MKRYSALFLALLALMGASLANADSGRRRTFDGLAAADTGPAFANVPAATADHPVTYAAYDGGYIEAGDPVAGETPPTPAAVADAVRTLLSAQNFQPAPAGGAPAVDFTIHWGVIRVSSFQRSVVDMDPNFHARVTLVAPPLIARDIRDSVRNRSLGFPSVLSRTPDWRDSLQLARDARYFIILTAYDHAALMRGETAALWRVRMSAADNSGRMAEVIPALALASGPYFGQKLDHVTYVRVPELADTAGQSQGAFPQAGPLPGATTENYLRDLVKQEHDYFSGDKLPPWDHDGWTLRVTRPKGTAQLPSDLQKQIAAYQSEKRALQSALSDRLQTRAPGEETRRAIDRFNEEHEKEIAALNRSRARIRTELARFTASTPNASKDRNIDALLNEFAADAEGLGAGVASSKP